MLRPYADMEWMPACAGMTGIGGYWQDRRPKARMRILPYKINAYIKITEIDFML
jgi:hypothetical protein